MNSTGLSGNFLPVMMAFVFSVCFAVVLLIFVGFCLFLVLTGQTQIEFYENAMKKRRLKKGEKFVNEYDLGLKKNFQFFFGTGRNWYTFLWPSTKLVAGDGINFQTVSSL